MNCLYLCCDDRIDLAGSKGAAVHVRAMVQAFRELGHGVWVIASQVSSPESFQAVTGAAARLAPTTLWQEVLERAIHTGNKVLGPGSRRGRHWIRRLHVAACGQALGKAATDPRPDFIYERYCLWGTAGLRLARKYSVPLVLEVNAPLVDEQERYRSGFLFPPLARRVEHQIWRGADLLIGVSETLGGYFEKAGVDAHQVRILPNAVDTNLFTTRSSAADLRRRLRLEGQFIIGFVGGFKPWHGVDFLLQVFARLRQEDASYHLLLVGDGPGRGALEEQVRGRRLTEAVTLIGSVPHEQVPSYLAVMDVATAPYPPLENFYFSPLKLYEYMAAGRAIVAAHIGQVAQAIDDGRTGLLYPPGDSQEMERCIRRLRHDEKLRIQLGLSASASCALNTWRQTAARVIQWVEPLVGGGPSHPTGQTAAATLAFSGTAAARCVNR